jgi:hypothetical protein
VNLWWYITGQLALSLNWNIVIGVALTIMAINTMVLLLIISMYKRYSRPLNAGAVTADTDTSIVLMSTLPAVKTDKVGFMDVTTAMCSGKWWPVETCCLFKAAMHLVHQAELSIALTIESSIAVDTVTSILQRKSVKALHVGCRNLNDDVIAAFSQHELLQQSLQNSSITACTVDTRGRLNRAALQGLVEHLPESLATLQITEIADEDVMLSDDNLYSLQCPASTKQLELKFVGCTVDKPEGLLALRVHSCSPSAWWQLPTTLQELHVSRQSILSPALPHGLLVLDVSGCFLSSEAYDIATTVLPETLTTLKLPDTQTQRVQQWPPRLQVLDVGHMYQQDLGVLPDSLTELTLKLQRHLRYEYPLSALPPGLQKLDTCGLNIAVQNLPEGLQVLRLDNYHFPLTELPPTLRELLFNSDQLVVMMVLLPETLEVLDVAYCYNLKQWFAEDLLPQPLHTLRISTVANCALQDVRSTTRIDIVPPRCDMAHRIVW